MCVCKSNRDFEHFQAVVMGVVRGLVVAPVTGVVRRLVMGVVTEARVAPVTGVLVRAFCNLRGNLRSDCSSVLPANMNVTNC